MPRGWVDETDMGTNETYQTNINHQLFRILIAVCWYIIGIGHNGVFRGLFLGAFGNFGGLHGCADEIQFSMAQIDGAEHTRHQRHLSIVVYAFALC